MINLPDLVDGAVASVLERFAPDGLRRDQLAV